MRFKKEPESKRQMQKKKREQQREQILEEAGLYAPEDIKTAKQINLANITV